MENLSKDESDIHKTQSNPEKLDDALFSLYRESKFDYHCLKYGSDDDYSFIEEYYEPEINLPQSDVHYFMKQLSSKMPELAHLGKAEDIMDASCKLLVKMGELNYVDSLVCDRKLYENLLSQKDEAYSLYNTHGSSIIYINSDIDLHHQESHLESLKKIKSNELSELEELKSKKGLWFDRIFKRDEYQMHKDKIDAKLEVIKDVSVEIEETQISIKDLETKDAIITDIHKKNPLFLRLFGTNGNISNIDMGEIPKLSDIDKYYERIQLNLDSVKTTLNYFNPYLKELEIMNSCKYKVINLYKNQYVPIKHITENTAKAILDLNATQGKVLSVSDIKDLHKKIGNQIDRGETTNDIQKSYDKLTKIVIDLQDCSIKNKALLTTEPTNTIKSLKSIDIECT